MINPHVQIACWSQHRPPLLRALLPRAQKNHPIRAPVPQTAPLGSSGRETASETFSASSGDRKETNQKDPAAQRLLLRLHRPEHVLSQEPIADGSTFEARRPVVAGFDGKPTGLNEIHVGSPQKKTCFKHKQTVNDRANTT